MKNYTVVEQDSLVKLEEIVRRNLNEGWVCQGGIHTDIFEEMTQYYQAMVLVEKA